MALELSFGRKDHAGLLEAAVEAALAAVQRTADIAQPGMTPLSTSGMGDAILGALDRLAR